MHDALRVPEARKLHEADRVAEQVARGGLRLEPFAEALADRQIERVARHLVHVRDIAVERVASARADPADADDSFADAVVENAGREADPAVLVKQSGVDQIGRLSLHRPVVFAALLAEQNLAFDPSGVQRQHEIVHADERKAFPEIDLDAVVAGRAGVLERKLVGAAGIDIVPFDRILEMLVEDGDRNRFAGGRIEFVAQVDVLHDGLPEVRIAGNRAEHVEIVVSRRRQLAELLPVDAHAVCQPDEHPGRQVIRGVERRQRVVVSVGVRPGPEIGFRRIAFERRAVAFETDAGVDVEAPERHVQRRVGGQHVAVGRVVVRVVRFVLNVQLVGCAQIFRCEDLLGGQRAETGGQLVLIGIPLVEEVAGSVAARFVFAV